MAIGNSQPSAPTRRPNRIIGIIIAVIVVLAIAAPMLIGVYTNWLWFGEVNFRGVFNKTWLVRIALFLICAVIAGAITYVAGLMTWQGRPSDLGEEDLNSPVHQYRMLVERSVRGLLIGLPIIVGVIAGLFGQGTWRTVMMFLNSQDFGQTDAEFGYDLGFYAFKLPFLQTVTSGLSAMLIVAFLIALIGHYLLGGIRIGNRPAGVRGSVSRPARIQLVVTAGLWMLVRVFQYWLDRFALLTNEHSTFTGASYTDVHAHLPAKIILMIIGVVVAFAFFSAIVLKDLRVPVLAAVLMVLSALVIGGAWPMLMERFSVDPNRAAKESEYIARNIEATREAYGITDEEVTYLEDWGADGAVKDDEVASDEETISNIRLLDPEILSPTFTQQQQLRNFYGFPDTLAVDRYHVDDELRDFVVAARELDPNALQQNQRDWINRHTVYTHGNGFIAAPGNHVDEVARDVGSTRGGYPVYTVSDLQTNEMAANDDAVEELGIKVEEPRIYFGPVISSATDGADYAVVGADTDEPVEYDTDNSNYTYSGDGGVDIGNWINRLAFAGKYQELNLILSDRVGSDSKIIFDRDPRTRVEKVAPWLTTDSKTYPAVIDGRIKWIVDGYTTLDSLPYTAQTSLQGATEDALNPEGTDQRLIYDRVGYIRNSVKATVDAYDGTVELYEFDTEDPVLKAWEGIFPGTVKPESEISDELRDHLRYPEDLFKVQRELLAKYHVDDPGVFFTNDAFWSVPGDPTAPEERRSLAQPPYYVVASDPNNPDEASFQLITPFRGLNREFLSAHMSVNSDPDNYGEITVRVLPTNTQTQGPKQAQDTMMSSDQIARDRTLWETTTDLHNGNLLTLPVGGGQILYVEPIYSQRKNQESAFPKLLRVLISYNGQVGYAPTISEALAQVGIDPKAAQDLKEVEGNADVRRNDAHADAAEGDDQDEDDAEEEEKTMAPAGGSGAAGAAVEKINDALNGLERARSGTHEEYGKALDELDRAVEEYQRTAGN